MVAYFALAENEAVGRIQYNLLQVNLKKFVFRFYSV